VTVTGRWAGQEGSATTYAADERVDAYIAALPDWQQAVCRQVRDLVHAADPEVSETIKRSRQPYFVLQGNICALLAAKDHVNVFLYDGGIVPDPDGIITAGHDNKTARTAGPQQRMHGSRSVISLCEECARRPAVIWSPNLGVFAVSAAGVLCAFSCVVDALPGQCLSRRSGASPLVAAVFRTKRLRHERYSATCQRRRRPGQARHRQGRLQITCRSGRSSSCSLGRLNPVQNQPFCAPSPGLQYWPEGAALLVGASV